MREVVWVNNIKQQNPEKNNKKRTLNIQTNKLGLSISSMDIDSSETIADRKKAKGSVSIAVKVTAKKRWGKLKLAYLDGFVNEEL